MMKKLLRAGFGLVLAVMTFGLVGCEEDPNGGGNATKDDLIGSWIIEYTDMSMEMIFAENGTISSIYSYQGKAEEPETATYTVEDGMLIISYDQWDSWYTPEILGDGNVLIMKYYVPDSLKRYQKYDEFEMYYRKGAKINVDKKDIKGEWHWYLHGNDSIIRTALVVDDQMTDLLIPVWRERYQCAFGYDNGYLVGDIERFAVRDYSDESVENLFKDWNFDFQDPQYYSSFEGRIKIPFYPVGDKAYSSVANLPCIFQKK